jgi:hypothetical protein
MGRKKKTKVQLPWGRAAGLLIACASTVAGAVQGAGPSYLLYRAFIGSVVACLVVTVFVRIVTATSVPGKS